MHALCAVVIFWATFQSGIASDPNFINNTALSINCPRKNLNFTELVVYDGYKCETHTVVTEDGYILIVFRIPPKETCDPESVRVVVYMHGLYLSGDDCIIPGPKYAHCYIYSDNCFDVWIPNSRGNRYSRAHTKWNCEKDPEYWNFTWDDMGLKDSPAVIDYILNVTKKQQLSYVAHSQGVAALVLLCARKLEYNSKIHVIFGLSPTAYLDHSTLIVLSLQASIAAFTTGLSNSTNVEIFAYGGFTQKAVSILCGLSKLEYPICSIFVFALFGYNKFHITEEVLCAITGHTPAGTSAKNFLRWGKIKECGGFPDIDYGASENNKKYGQATPPQIDISGVTTKLILFASDIDNVGTVADVKTLHSKLQNSVVCVLKGKSFMHIDFIYANVLSEYITPHIVSYLKTGNCTCDGELIY